MIVKLNKIINIILHCNQKLDVGIGGGFGLINAI